MDGAAAPLLSTILVAASAEAGSCMQNASVSTSAMRRRRCFFKTIPPKENESRIIDILFYYSKIKNKTQSILHKRRFFCTNGKSLDKEARRVSLR